MLPGGKDYTSNVSTALEAGACLPENFHLATRLCTPALTHLEQHPHHQRPIRRGPDSAVVSARGAVQSGTGTPRLARDGHSASPGRELVTGTAAVLWGSRRSPWSVSSESAFEQAVTPTPGGTHLLGPEPLHHVAGVSPVPAGQAEVGRPPHGHVADGALEREALADGALRAADLAPAVAAVHAELCERSEMPGQETASVQSCKSKLGTAS